MVAVTVKGGTELLAKLDLYRERAQPAANAALYQRGLKIMAASDVNVPVDTGRTRASHYVEIPDDQGVLKMGYGTSYALPLHENLAAHHEHGQAKFLEHAMDEARADNARWIREKTLENIRRGVELSTGSMPTSAEAGDITGAHHQANRMNRERK